MIPNLLARIARKGSLRNVVWNLVGTFLTGLLMVVATPVYVGRLGLEGFGIVGLWTILQFLMGLLDLGIGATLVREFAHAGARPGGNKYRRDLLRTLELAGWSVSLAFSAVLAFCSTWIAGSWLKLPTLPEVYVAHAIQVMALAMGLQFPLTLYSNSLCGLQEQGRMNLVQILGSCARYGIGIAVLFWKADLIWFFGAQAIVAAAQTLCTRAMVWRLISTGPQERTSRPSLSVLKGISSFSAGMAMNTLIGVLLGNVDRLLVSGHMTATDLGRYTAAYTAASMLQMGIQPFYRAYFPRYSELVSEGNEGKLEQEYFQSNILMGATIVPISIIALMFAPEIFLVWFGKTDPDMLHSFRWLVAGMAGAGVAWLPAAYQQAHGWTSLHVGMMLAALLVGTPLAFISLRIFGTPGAAVVWVTHGLLEVSLGLWLMHRRLLQGHLLEWYRSVLFVPLLVGLPVSIILKGAMPEGLSRAGSLAWVVFTGIVVLVATLYVSLRWLLIGYKQKSSQNVGVN